jgi:hypothetical protein
MVCRKTGPCNTIPFVTISAVNSTMPVFVLILMSPSNRGFLTPLCHGPKRNGSDHGEREERERANAHNVLVAEFDKRHGSLTIPLVSILSFTLRGQSNSTQSCVVYPSTREQSLQ